MLYPRQKGQMWTMKIFDFSKEIDRDALREQFRGHFRRQNLWLRIYVQLSSRARNGTDG